MSTYTPFLTALRTLIGAPYVRTGADATGFHTDERNRYHHAPLAVVLPETVAQISAIVQLCATHHIAIIAPGSFVLSSTVMISADSGSASINASLLNGR